MSDVQFAEAIKFIEYFQHTDLKAESLIYPVVSHKKLWEQELIKKFWNELEEWLKAYQDITDKHKALYNHAKKIRDNFMKANDTSNSSKIQGSKHSDSVDTVKKETNISDILNRLAYTYLFFYPKIRIRFINFSEQKDLK